MLADFHFKGSLNVTEAWFRRVLGPGGCGGDESADKEARDRLRVQLEARGKISALQFSLQAALATLDAKPPKPRRRD